MWIGFKAFLKPIHIKYPNITISDVHDRLRSQRKRVQGQKRFGLQNY